jgi:hypothetical protein
MLKELFTTSNIPRGPTHIHRQRKLYFTRQLFTNVSIRCPFNRWKTHEREGDFGRRAHALNKLAQLIRTFFKLDGHHIQFNVVSSDMLRDAQKHPERYRDLIVRVAGYSDYFVDLSADLQNEIIKRTEQRSF